MSSTTSMLATRETALHWLDEQSPYFADIRNPENRSAVAELVTRIWKTYGLAPVSGVSRPKSGYESYLTYDPNFVCFELLKDKPGFKLLVRPPRGHYASISDEYFAQPRGSTPRIHIKDIDRDLEVAWAAIKQAAEIEQLVPRMRDNPLTRITSDPTVCGGRPCVRHMRIRVTDILEMLAGGASADEILRDYPYLEREDLSACLAFAARSLDHPILRAS